jgi:hypothetical protein
MHFVCIIATKDTNSSAVWSELPNNFKRFFLHRVNDSTYSISLSLMKAHGAIVLPNTQSFFMRIYLPFLTLILLPILSTGQTLDNKTRFIQDELLSIHNFEGRDFFDYQKLFESAVTEILMEIQERMEVVILLSFSKDAPVKQSIHSKPLLADSTLLQLQSTLSEIPSISTLYSDFDVKYTYELNKSSKRIRENFSPPVPAIERKNQENFRPLSLAEKIEQTQKWSRNAALPILQSILDGFTEDFSSVKQFNKELNAYISEGKESVIALTDLNETYWKARNEVVLMPTLLPLIKIVLLTAEGRFEYAQKQIQLIYSFSANQSTLIYFLEELSWRISYCLIEEENLIQQLQQKSVDHEKLKDSLVALRPNSFNALLLDFNFKTLQTASKKDVLTEDWENLQRTFPMYEDTISPQNNLQAYQNDIRIQLYDLFVEPEKYDNDFGTYAQFALDIEAYAVAAELFLLFDQSDYLYQGKNIDYRPYFLYCLHQLSINSLDPYYTDIRKKSDKKIGKAQKKRMKKSSIYKNFTP